jgi:hypothetical protein
MKGHKKVHIVPVAFDVDRAVAPVKEIGADKVYILCGAQEGEAPLSPAAGEKVKSRLRNYGPRIVNYGFYDYKSIFKELVRIAREERSNDVLVNLSTGGHIVTICATLVASMYGWTPYYAVPKDYKDGKMQDLKTIFEVQTYPIDPPGEHLVECLRLVEGIQTQKSLMLRLEKEGIMSDAEPGSSFSKRSYMEFRRRFLDPLREKGWIECSGKGKSMRLEINERGREIREIFA